MLPLYQSLSPLTQRIIRETVAGLTFLIKENFNTDHPAPLVAPINADPGPGIWDVITDANARFSISGGKHHSSDQSIGTYMYLDVPVTRKNGMLLDMRLQPVSAVLNRYGLSPTRTSQLLGTFFLPSAVLNLASTNNSGGSTTFQCINSGVNYGVESNYTIWLRDTAGCFYIYNNTLIMVEDRITAATQYVGTSQNSNVTGSQPDRTLDNVRVVDLLAEGYDVDDDWHLANHYDASLSEGEYFTHDADTHIEFFFTTFQNGGNVDIYFRMQSESPLNCWCLRITNSVNTQLYEVVNGTFTQRFSSASGLKLANTRFYVFARGTTIVLYRSNQSGSLIGQLLSQTTYTSANNFSTETDGKVADLGTTDAVIRDFAVYPYNLPPSVTDILDAVRNA